jgi:hypothetical protein
MPGRDSPINGEFDERDTKIRGDRAMRSGVDDRKVRRHTGLQFTRLQAVKRSGIHRHQSDELPQGQDIFIYKFTQTEGKSSLKADHTAGRFRKRKRFLLFCMRRVIGGDDVQRSVGQALEYGLPVAFGAQRGIDLCEGPPS